MSNQDWEPIVLKKKTPKKPGDVKGVMNYSGQEVQVDSIKKMDAGKNTQHTDRPSATRIEQKMESEDYHLTTVSLKLRTTIQQERMKKGWTQKQFATMCNLPETIVKSYEQGKGTPKTVEIQKMSKVLGVPLSNKE